MPSGLTMEPLEILLVEDNAGDALLATQALAEAPLPVKVHIARDGAQALQMLASFQPNIVILDLRLPEIDGLKMLEYYHPTNVPIVVFSGSNRESDKLLAKASGASEYIVKPFDLRAFRSALWGIVERWGRKQGSGAGP